MFGIIQNEKPSFPRECTRYNSSGCDASTCDPSGYNQTLCSLEAQITVLEDSMDPVQVHLNQLDQVSGANLYLCKGSDNEIWNDVNFDGIFYERMKETSDHEILSKGERLNHILMFKTQDQSEITGKCLCVDFFPEDTSHIIAGGQFCPGNCLVPIVTGVAFEPSVGQTLESHITTNDLGCWQS